MMLIQIKLNNIYWRKVYEILQKYAIIYDALGNSCDPQFHGFKGLKTLHIDSSHTDGYLGVLQAISVTTYKSFFSPAYSVIILICCFGTQH